MRLAACHAIVADPPWRFGDSLPGPSRGASKNYPTLSFDELIEFRLPPIADDALLFLWRVASMQQEALDVGKAWGFDLKTEIVWNKLTKTGKPWFGMGRITRAAHETCLVFKRGRPVIKNKSVRSTFEAQVTEHSGKPGEFFRIVEQLVDGPYTELFSRKRRPGWQCLGNEVDARLPKPENPGSQLAKQFLPASIVGSVALGINGCSSASRLILPGESIVVPPMLSEFDDDPREWALT